MSTTNVTPAVPENLAAGLKLFNAKLLPGKLADTTENAATLATWVRSRGITLVSLPAAEIAETLYTAAKSLYYNEVLTWDAVPTKLKAELEREYAIKFEQKQIKEHGKDTQENSENAFYERAKKYDEAQKAEKQKTNDEITLAKIKAEIMTYECYAGPGRRDYAKIEQRRDYLFKLAEKYKATPDVALAKVRAQIMEWD